jgi:hypothetical protein
MSEMPSEQRLDQLRDEAQRNGTVKGRSVDIASGPIPQRIGYYGQPVLKPPVWTWEIPVYFFVGGIAGMSAVIALFATLHRMLDLAKLSLLIAAIGAVVSPILLTMDLGRPRLFLNMLRVFKYQSPMSVGAWILILFGASAVPGVIALELQVPVLAALFICGSAFFGIFLATYTGVLIGATAIPVWFLHRVLLPIHFGAAGLGSAAALLELFGHRIEPLNGLGFLAAGIETALWIWLEIDRHGAADRALRESHSGWLIRVGEILSGPLALLLRGVGIIPFAAIAFLVGSLVSRFGWISAGKVCGSDPEAAFAAQH